MGSISLFGSLLAMCGMTHEECADYLGVRLDSVRSWSSGRRNVPQGVEAKLIELWNLMEDEASRIIDGIEAQLIELSVHGLPQSIEFGIPSSREEANELGWPSVGTFMRIAALVASNVEIRLDLVERGSTLASQQAIYARKKGELDLSLAAEKLAKCGGRLFSTPKIPIGIAFTPSEAIANEHIVAFWQTPAGTNPLFQERVVVDGEELIVVAVEVLP